jgi:diacylglycerol kinase family enzyme
MLPRLLLLANPAASGFTGGVHREVVTILREGYEVDASWPSSPDDARDQAARAALEGVDMVVAFGGDGVVHHVANGIVGSTTALGVIPAGTTNVLARILGIPSKPVDAARFLTEDARVRRIPATVLHLHTVDGETDKRTAVFATGVGLDAEVVEVAEQEPYRKYRFGSIHYARSAASVVLGDFRGRAANLRVVGDHRHADAVAVFAQIHPMYTYFGPVPMRLAEHVPDTLTLLVVKELPTRRVLPIVARALTTGDVDKVAGCEVWTGVRTAIIQAEPPATMQADGELLGSIVQTELTAEPDALLVAAPPEQRRRRGFRR